jgi:amino acid adenylation domain-containing protein
VVQSPRTPHEEILCELVADVLALDRVGLDDDFFAIGGHSLAAMRLIARVERAFGVSLEVREIFDRPIVSDLAASIAERTQGAGDAAARPALPKILPRPARLPLSYEQQRLWFLDRLHGTSSHYHMTSILPLRHAIDIAALRQAIDTLVARHEALRTRFTEDEDGPIQIVDPPGHPDPAVVDLSGLDAREQRRRISAELQLERSTPLDLVAGPPIRLKLITVAPEEHLLVRTIHHIVSDGWSTAIFRREFHTLYDAFRQGLENPLPPIAAHSADFAVWQRSTGTDQALDEYWDRQLAGMPLMLNLPTARPRPPLQTFRADLHRLMLTAEQSADLRRMCREHHTTLYMAMLAALGVLLSRYSGQDDVAIGSPFANRPDPLFEDSIGFFVNTVVLRVRTPATMTIGGLLAQVRTTALDAHAHQHIPFERIVERLAPPRRLDRSPVFQVTFALQNLPDVEPVGRPIAGRAGAQGDLRARFDLEVTAGERDGRVVVSWLYNRDLYDHAWIEQLATHYARILDAFVHDPACELGSIELLSEGERQAMADLRKVVESPAITVVERIEEEAAARPHATAVRCDGVSSSYSALNAHANRLSDWLTRHGAGPNDIVAVALPRSVALVTTVLGVLKSGAACLMLDPEYPSLHLSRTMDEVRPRAVITTTDTLPALPRDLDPILLDDPATVHALERAASTNPQAGRSRGRLRPDSAAYVAYTAGTSGKAKPAIVTHGGVMSTLVGLERDAPIQASDCVLALRTVASDAGLFDILRPLAAGATVILASSEDVLYPAALADLLRREQVTQLCAPPRVLRALTQAAPDAIVGCTVLVGRETVTPGGFLASDRIARTIFNLYGVTEASVWSTCGRLEAADARCSTAGTAIGHARVAILDAHLRQVPRGALGDVYIGGPGLARGYLHRSAATAARFVADPYGPPGSRMFATGDVARRMLDGDLELLDRRDDPASGGRLSDLQQIEAALCALEDIRDAAAAFPFGPDSRPVAHIVPVAGHSVEAATLMRVLSRVLPNVLVPETFVCVDALPLTPDGRLDRPRLGHVPARRAADDRPRTDTEETLAAIWRTLLQRDEVGLHDDFFRIGGHSLLAMRLATRIEQRFGVSVALKDVFDRPTLVALATAIEEQVLDEIERMPDDAANRLAWGTDAAGPA